jgi:hypothetical protein
MFNGVKTTGGGWMATGAETIGGIGFQLLENIVGINFCFPLDASIASLLFLLSWQAFQPWCCLFKLSMPAALTQISSPQSGHLTLPSASTSVFCMKV